MFPSTEENWRIIVYFLSRKPGIEIVRRLFIFNLRFKFTETRKHVIKVKLSRNIKTALMY